MDRKRTSTAPLLLESRSMHGGSQGETFYQQFPSLEPKISKLLPDLPFSLSPEYSLFDLLPDIPPQPEIQTHDRSDARFAVHNEQGLSKETVEVAADCSPCTSRKRRKANFSDYNAGDDVPVVDLADSPTSSNSYSSGEDSDVVIYEGTTRREPQIDESVVCLDNDDQETDNLHPGGDQSDLKSISSQHIEDPEPSTNVADVSMASQLAGNDDNVTSNTADSHITSLKTPVPSYSQHISRMLGEEIESEKAMVKTLKAELKVQKQNYEWQEAKVRYLESKLQERNDFEYKLEAVNQLNDMLEKKLSELEKSATNLPIFEKEVKRLREKTRLLEEDKRCKEELGQTISNLIDDKTSLKTENESLTSIAGMLEKENSTLKQRCEALEKAAEKSTVCTGDNLIAENCCIRTKELRDRITESLENEFKCSICEEVFIEATVTNCNHVFCAHCLSEWMKKKRDCPYCRKHVSQQCRAPVIDEFVMTVCKMLSEKMHNDRSQVVLERKILASKKVPQPTSARKLIVGGSVRLVPTASLLSQGLPSSGRALAQISAYPRAAAGVAQPGVAVGNSVTASVVGPGYYPPAQRDEFAAARAYDHQNYYYGLMYPSAASSTATSSTAPATTVQMLPLDARIARTAASAQSTATASSAHVSSTSSGAAATASSSANSAYPYSWSNLLDRSLYGGGSRPSVTAANPFASMDTAEAPPVVPRTHSGSARSSTSASRSATSALSAALAAALDRPSASGSAPSRSSSYLFPQDLDRSSKKKHRDRSDRSDRKDSIRQLAKALVGSSSISSSYIYEAEKELYAKMETAALYEKGVERLLRHIKIIKKKIGSGRHKDTFDGSKLLRLVKSL